MERHFKMQKHEKFKRLLWGGKMTRKKERVGGEKEKEKEKKKVPSVNYVIHDKFLCV